MSCHDAVDDRPFEDVEKPSIPDIPPRIPVLSCVPVAPVIKWIYRSHRPLYLHETSTGRIKNDEKWRFRVVSRVLGVKMDDDELLAFSLYCRHDILLMA